MRIEQQLTIAAPPERVWSFLMDIPAMAQCLPGVEQVTQVAEDKYTARVKQKVGPISVAFDCQITVLSIDESAYSATAQVSGRDGKVGAGMKAVMSMRLEPQESGVVLAMATDADISGKIAQYGHGIIRQRANAMLDSFGQCVSAKMAADERPDAGAP